MLDEAGGSGRFFPSQASKLSGTLNFLESGGFGRVGCGDLQALKEHQYGSSYTTSPTILGCFEVARAILKEKPHGLMQVMQHSRRRGQVQEGFSCFGPLMQNMQKKHLLRTSLMRSTAIGKVRRRLRSSN
eukprot:s1276_g37.t1